MKQALRHHLTHLDRTLISLFNERARLFAAAGREAEELQAHLDDLLARSPGPFPAREAEQLFAALDRGCREAGR